jgi:hypothetical protein
LATSICRCNLIWADEAPPDGGIARYGRRGAWSGLLCFSQKRQEVTSPPPPPPTTVQLYSQRSVRQRRVFFFLNLGDSELGMWLTVDFAWSILAYEPPAMESCKLGEGDRPRSPAAGTWNSYLANVFRQTEQNNLHRSTSAAHPAAGRWRMLNWKNGWLAYLPLRDLGLIEVG